MCWCSFSCGRCCVVSGAPGEQFLAPVTSRNAVFVSRGGRQRCSLLSPVLTQAKVTFVSPLLMKKWQLLKLTSGKKSRNNQLTCLSFSSFCGSPLPSFLLFNLSSYQNLNYSLLSTRTQTIILNWNIKKNRNQTLKNRVNSKLIFILKLKCLQDKNPEENLFLIMVYTILAKHFFLA